MKKLMHDPKNGNKPAMKKAGYVTAAVFALILPLVAQGCKKQIENPSGITPNGVVDAMAPIFGILEQHKEAMEGISKDLKASGEPIIDIEPGQVYIDLTANPNKRADASFAQYLTAKKAATKAEVEVASTDGIEKCVTEGYKPDQSADVIIPIARCDDLDSIEYVCESACNEKNAKDAAACTESCFGGALSRLINAGIETAKRAYHGLLGNGICQWGNAVVRVGDQTARITVYNEQGTDDCPKGKGGSKPLEIPGGTATDGRTQ